MATVTIRIEDDVREDLEQIARTRQVTVSDLLRDQIDGLLGRGVPMRDETPHALSFQERQILAQQHKILQMLHADEGDSYESEHHRAMAGVLREGYAGEYDSVFGGMEEEMPRSECKLLWDILDMFRIIGVSVDRLSDEGRAALSDDDISRLRFAGFDLNDRREGRLLGYVRYLVDTGRWTEIRERLAEIGDNGNSHSRRLPSYERMLAVYTPIWEQHVRGPRGYSPDGELLTAGDLRQIAEVWVWPSGAGKPGA